MNKMFIIILFLSLISFFCSKKEQVLTESFKSNPDTTITFQQYDIGNQPEGGYLKSRGTKLKQPGL